MESDFWPSEMEHRNGIVPKDDEFDQEVITQPEQAGPSTDSIARQSVTQSAEMYKDQVEQYSRPRRAQKRPERYRDYVETENAIKEEYDNREIVWKYD